MNLKFPLSSRKLKQALHSLHHYGSVGANHESETCGIPSSPGHEASTRARCLGFPRNFAPTNRLHWILKIVTSTFSRAADSMSLTISCPNSRFFELRHGSRGFKPIQILMHCMCRRKCTEHITEVIQIFGPIIPASLNPILCACELLRTAIDTKA